MHGADHPVGPHRVDDVLRVRAGARIVVDLGADGEAHAAAQPLRNDRRMRNVDARGFCGAVQVAGFGEFERAPHRVHRARILERQIIDVIADHHEARRSAPARMVEPEEQHARANTRSAVPRKMACARLSRARERREWRRCEGRSAFYFLYSARDPQLRSLCAPAAAPRSGVRCSTHGTTVSIENFHGALHEFERHRRRVFGARAPRLGSANTENARSRRRSAASPYSANAEQFVQRLIANVRAGRVRNVAGDAVLGPGGDDFGKAASGENRASGPPRAIVSFLRITPTLSGWLKSRTLTATRSTAIAVRPPA